MAKVALYVRVSTHKDQTVENQLIALREWARAAGHTIVAEFADEGISGTKGRDKRPALDAMLQAAVRRQVDMVAVTALDRLGRSLPHLVQLAAELEALRVGLFVRNLAMDTSTPAGRLMFNVMGSLAEFERELIRERTLLGLDRARRQGKRLGRPPVPAETERRIAALLGAKTPINRIARLTRVSMSVIYRVRENMACTA
ncbi:recombinase family protein [Pseudoxanthomonas sp. 10H]|uniref:recombinase family protein n=1 Tax=Pseudoxanthomonas sp. 10H TaxID=3242729 RepID=UPI003557FAE2